MKNNDMNEDNDEIKFSLILSEIIIIIKSYHQYLYLYITRRWQKNPRSRNGEKIIRMVS